MPKKSRSVRSTPVPTFAGLQRGTTEFNPDYTNIKRDLKRIGILACTFFAILIVLSFFLH